MVGVGVAGLGYQLASAAGLDDKIDELWNQHGEPLRQKTYKENTSHKIIRHIYEHP